MLDFDAINRAAVRDIPIRRRCGRQQVRELGFLPVFLLNNRETLLRWLVDTTIKLEGEYRDCVCGNIGRHIWGVASQRGARGA